MKPILSLNFKYTIISVYKWRNNMHRYSRIAKIGKLCIVSLKPCNEVKLSPAAKAIQELEDKILQSQYRINMTHEYVLSGSFDEYLSKHIIESHKKLIEGWQIQIQCINEKCLIAETEKILKNHKVT